jgi:hypothetical protein
MFVLLVGKPQRLACLGHHLSSDEVRYLYRKAAEVNEKRRFSSICSDRLTTALHHAQITLDP